MSSGNKKQTIGYRYFLGMHMILCLGPIDAIKKILADDKEAWAGDTTGGSITVDAPNLFGGDEKEGGIAGQFDIEMGSPAQGVNGYLSSVLSPELLPAYRGVCGVVMRQIYVGTQAYLKKLAFLATRIHKRQTEGLLQWYDEKSAIIDFTAVSILFDEQFDNGLNDYIITGTNTFSVDGGILTFYGGATTTSKAVRTVPTGTFTKIAFKFRLNDLKSDDCGILTFVSASDGLLFAFVMARESTYDSLRRPTIIFTSGDGQLGNQLGAGSVPLNVWHECVVVYDAPTQKFNYTVTNMATSLVFASGIINVGLTAQVGKIHFSTDGGVNSGSVSYDNVTVETVGNSGDMNPAHIIRECLTDPDFGLGYQDTDIDDVAFQAAADKLHAESFGVSILWNRQSAVEEFIKEIVQYIDAALYVDKSTGQFTLKLIRDDFSEAGLLVLDESNIDKISDFTRPSFGELTNSVTVQFWDRELLSDSSVTVQDIALSQMQGTTINTTAQYPGVTNKKLAARIAERDLKTLSTPLASCTIYTNRVAADLNIGSVFKLTWADYKVSNLVMRVTSIAYGDGRTNRIRLTCTQDIYKMPSTALIAPEVPVWEDPNAAPVAATLRLPFEVPYLEAVQQLGQTAVDAAIATENAASYAGIAVGRPSQGAINAGMWVNAGDGFENQATIDFCATATTVDEIGFMTTAIQIADIVAVDSVADGTWLQCEDEIMVKVSLVGDLLTVKRGALDTVPTIHAAGSALFFWDENSGIDETQYVEGETVEIKVTPTTGQGSLALADAAIDSLDLQGRLFRPYPPGNVKINDAYFPSSVENIIALTWAHRDRKLQTGTDLLDFTSASVGPEPGTTYDAVLRNASTLAILDQKLNVTGASASLTTTSIGGMLVELNSKRDGVTSLFKHSIPVDFLSTGILITEAGQAILAEDGDFLVTESYDPGGSLPYQLTFTFTGVFSTDDVFAIDFGLSGFGVGTIVDGAGKASFADMVAQLVFQLQGVTAGSGYSGVLVTTGVGNSVVVRSDHPFLEAHASSAFVSSNVFVQQLPMPITVGIDETSFIDFYAGGTAVALSPSFNDSFKNTGTANFEFWIEAKTWEARKQMLALTGSFGLKNYRIEWTVTDPANPHYLEALIGQGTTLPAALNAVPNMATFQLSAAVAGPDFLQTRQAVRITGAGNFSAMVRNIPTVDYQHPSFYQPFLKLNRSWGIDLPAGAKQVTTISLNLMTGRVVEAGQRYTLTLDTQEFTYVATGADTTFEHITNGLAALINPGGKFVVSWFASQNMIEIERTVANVAFTTKFEAKYDSDLIARIKPTGDVRRVFFWYDPATNSSVMAEDTTETMLNSGASAVGPLSRQPPNNKWISAISLENPPFVWYVRNTDNSRLHVLPQPNFGAGQFASVFAYDSATDKYFGMSYSNDGAITKEHVLNALTGVLETSTTVTVGGGSVYQFYPWQLLKFGGVWHSFEANSSFTNHYKRDAGAANWVEDSTDWYGTPAASAKSTIGADTLQAGATLAVMVDFVDTGVSPQAHYLRFLTSADGTTFTQRGTFLLNSGAGLGSTSGTVEYVIYAGGGYGNQFIRIGTKLAYFWYTTTTGGAGPGLYVLISSDDGVTWTPHKCTLDGTSAGFPDRLISQICGNESGSIVLGRYQTNVGFDDNTCEMVKSTDGIAFTTISDLEIFAPGYADEPKDKWPLVNNPAGDIRAPILSSGNRILFERKLQ